MTTTKKGIVTDLLNATVEAEPWVIANDALGGEARRMPKLWRGEPTHLDGRYVAIVRAVREVGGQLVLTVECPVTGRLFDTYLNHVHVVR